MKKWIRRPAALQAKRSTSVYWLGKWRPKTWFVKQCPNSHCNGNVLRWWQSCGSCRLHAWLKSLGY